MIKKNLFRSLPLIPKKFLITDDTQLFMEVNWPHLSLIYAFIAQYQSLYPNDPHLDLNFVLELTSQSQSCDNNERECIVNFIISYVSTHQDFIPNIMRKYFSIIYGYLEGTHYPFGVSPALKFILSVVKLPNSSVLDMYKQFFYTGILPLLTTHHLSSFYSLLSQHFDYFISLDSSLSSIIIQYIISHWPVSFPSKQIIYLGILHKALEKMPLKQFIELSPKIFNFYADCMLSKSYKVAEVSLKIWNNNAIYSLIIENTKVIIPIVMKPLSHMMKKHWNENTRKTALITFQLIHNLDTNSKYTKKILEQPSQENDIQKIWALIARTGAKNDKELKLSPILLSIQLNFTQKKDENLFDTSPKKR